MTKECLKICIILDDNDRAFKYKFEGNEMGFTITFIKYFSIGIRLISPVLLTLVCGMAVFGFIIGKAEGWSRIDTFYYTCVTATTVGYGDFRPHYIRSKILAVVIAFLGLLLAGIVVAVALHALTLSFKESDRSKIIPVSPMMCPAEQIPNNPA
jgi:voltage-gated potassium channel